MKTFIFVTIAATCIAGSAFAGTPGSQSNGQTARLTGNTAAHYIDGVAGEVTCNETQHPKFDTVSCRPVTTRPDLAGQTFTYGWFSDFDNSILGTITYTWSADGTSYAGKATY